MTLTTSMPDEVQPRAGEEFLLRALVLEDGSLRVTRVIHREPHTAAPPDQPPQLMDWVNKWTGTMTLEDEETRDSLRTTRLNEKYGA
jgi:hypothetical protein